MFFLLKFWGGNSSFTGSNIIKTNGSGQSADNNTTITTTDIDGVSMLAIQALEQRTAELKVRPDELEKMKAELTKLKLQIEELSASKQNSVSKDEFEKLKAKIEKLNNLIGAKAEVKK